MAADGGYASRITHTFYAFARPRCRSGPESKRTTAAGLGRDGGDRILRCVGAPSCVAKNRYALPAELPRSWQALMTAMTTTPNDEKDTTHG